MLNTLNRMLITTPLVTSVNEDNVTAMELTRVCTRKVNECVEVINTTIKRVEEIYNKVNFSVAGEELAYSISENFTRIRKESNTLATNISNYRPSDQLTAMECAGCLANYINECARLVNELSANVESLDNAITISVTGDTLELPIGEE